MKKRINHVAPLQMGIVLCVLYAALSLLFVPLLILASLAGGPPNKGLPVVFLIFLPVLYAIVGFVGGVIVAALYNLIAKWTGGIELTLEDPPSKIVSGLQS